MGACSSCLGSREREVLDEDEENRLLYDDVNGIHYGSFVDASMNGENDTAEAQRENEALQRVVARTSSNMVDVFEIAPQGPAGRRTTASFAYAGQGARLARYQHLVSKLDAEDDAMHNGVKVDWFPEDDPTELAKDQSTSIQTLDADDGPLVGTFADAAAAMR